MIVHFDRLKPCPTDTRFPSAAPTHRGLTLRRSGNTPHKQPPPVGTDLELVEDDSDTFTPLPRNGHLTFRNTQSWWSQSPCQGRQFAIASTSTSSTSSFASLPATEPGSTGPLWAEHLPLNSGRILLRMGSCVTEQGSPLPHQTVCLLMSCKHCSHRSL